MSTTTTITSTSTTTSPNSQLTITPNLAVRNIQSAERAISGTGPIVKSSRRSLDPRRVTCPEPEAASLSPTMRKRYEKGEISGCHFETFHNLQQYCTHTPSLDLEANFIEVFPPEVGALTQLQTLTLQWNDLTTLPNEIGNLTQLQTLNLGFNKLTALPDGIGKLTNLTKLEVHNNKLTCLTESIGQLVNLTHFTASHNFLEKIPKALANCTRLKILQLDDNYLSSLPTNITQLQQLEQFSVADNRLKTLPEQIGKLQNLQIFSIGTNQFRSFPVSFLHLPRNCYVFEELPKFVRNKMIDVATQRIQRLNSQFYLVPSIAQPNLSGSDEEEGSDNEEAVRADGYSDIQLPDSKLAFLRQVLFVCCLPLLLYRS